MPSFPPSFGFFPFPTTPNYSAAITLTQDPARSSSGSPADEVLLLRGQECAHAEPRAAHFAQLNVSKTSLLQLSSRPGAWRPPLAGWVTFAPSAPHLLRLKVDGTGMVSQEQHCSSASIPLQFPPSSGCTWKSWEDPRAPGPEVRT